MSSNPYERTKKYFNSNIHNKEILTFTNKDMMIEENEPCQVDKFEPYDENILPTEEFLEEDNDFKPLVNCEIDDLDSFLVSLGIFNEDEIQNTVIKPDIVEETTRVYKKIIGPKIRISNQYETPNNSKKFNKTTKYPNINHSASTLDSMQFDSMGKTLSNDNINSQNKDKFDNQNYIVLSRNSFNRNYN